MSMMHQFASASAPASIGNVGVGFDILGQAFDAVRDVLPSSYPKTLEIDPVHFGRIHAANASSYGNLRLYEATWLCGTELSIDEDPESENMLRNCGGADSMPIDGLKVLEMATLRVSTVPASPRNPARAV